MATPTAVNTAGSEMAGKNITNIYTGSNTVAAIDSDNNTYMWGFQGSGQFANVLGPTPHSTTDLYRGVTAAEKLNINTTVIALIDNTAFGWADSSFYAW